jgi:hypothetical protein
LSETVEYRLSDLVVKGHGWSQGSIWLKVSSDVALDYYKDNALLRILRNFQGRFVFFVTELPIYEGVGLREKVEMIAENLDSLGIPGHDISIDHLPFLPPTPLLGLSPSVNRKLLRKLNSSFADR